MADGLRRRGPRGSAGGGPPPGDKAPDDFVNPNTQRPPTRSPANGLDSPASAAEPPSPGRTGGGSPRFRRAWSLVRAIQDNDEAKIEEAILHLSESRRVFAPLAFAVGPFAMLFNGLKLLVTNWRLTLVQILPAMWIWLAMFDLKAHVLHGESFTVVRGLVLIPIGLLIIAITVASFFLNAVFAFAVSRPGRPEVRPAVAQARQHLRPIMASGAVVGALLGVLDHYRHPMGTPLVHHFTRNRGRGDDDLLRLRPITPDRLQATQTIKTRQAGGDRSRGRTERDRVHAALHPRASGHPRARIERCHHFSFLASSRSRLE